MSENVEKNLAEKQEEKFENWDKYTFEQKEKMLNGKGAEIMEIIGKDKDEMTPEDVLHAEMILVANEILESRKEENKEEDDPNSANTLRELIGAARSESAQAGFRLNLEDRGLTALGTKEGTDYLFRRVVVPEEEKRGRE